MPVPTRGLIAHDHDWSVSFERLFPVPGTELWAALTRPQLVRRWLGALSGDLRRGGAYRLALDAETVVTGVVLDAVRERNLAVSWSLGPGEPSRVAAEIFPMDPGSRLVFVHHGLSWPGVADYGTNWHGYLDRLDAVLSGAVGDDWSDQVDEYTISHSGGPVMAGARIRRQHWLSSAPMEVWRALTDPERLPEWLGRPLIWPHGADGRPRRLTAGDRFAVVRGVESDPHVTIDVVRARPAHQWWLVWDSEHAAVPMRFQLTPLRGGTLLRLTLSRPDPDQRQETPSTGWARLVEVLEPGAERPSGTRRRRVRVGQYQRFARQKDQAPQGDPYRPSM